MALWNADIFLGSPIASLWVGHAASVQLSNHVVWGDCSWILQWKLKVFILKWENERHETLSISVESQRKTRNSSSIIAKLRELTISVLFNNLQTATSVHILNFIVAIHINFYNSPNLIPHKSLFTAFQIASCTVKVKSAEAVSCFREGGSCLEYLVCHWDYTDSWYL